MLPAAYVGLSSDASPLSDASSVLLTGSVVSYCAGTTGSTGLKQSQRCNRTQGAPAARLLSDVNPCSAACCQALVLHARNILAAHQPWLLPLCRKQELELEAAEEEALALRVEAAVQVRVAEAIRSDEVATRVAARLQHERAKLEERVTRQLDMERKLLLERKRREDAERRQAENEMEQIIADNKRKVWCGVVWRCMCAA